ncbi:MAG: thioredoxin family protein [Planctomycetaceae bacterium]|nr:thioredoxin family protein [Planctomycetaceae bacterium]
MFDFASVWPDGLSYTAFLDRFATPEQRRRWDAVHEQVRLTAAQIDLLRGFKRQMFVPVVAGAWCGDCIQQCPIWDHFLQHTDCIQIRYFDRDQNTDLADAVSLCGGRRVPTVVFLSEERKFCGLLGDRTLSKYRDLVASLDGAACPTGLVGPSSDLQAAVIQDWLNEFERVQGMLRTSPRLRQLHGD